MPVELVFKNNHCEWIDVEAATDEDLEYIHSRYEINDLWLEDTVDPNHLPKFEEDKTTKFFLTRENTELERTSLNSISDVSTKLSMFIMKGTIITVHRMKNKSIYEMKKDVFLHEHDATTDFIALQLALKVMKSYDEESENILTVIDERENEIFMKNTANPSQFLRKIYRLKRKSGLNTRILQISSEWVEKFKVLNLTDSQTTDLKDKYRDVTADFDHLNAQIMNLINMFLALTDQKANQTMKVLTQFSVYFLPITFIAGVYGMNFDNMPELKTKYGYFATLGLMAIIVLSTFLYSKRKRW